MEIIQHFVQVPTDPWVCERCYHPRVLSPRPPRFVGSTEALFSASFPLVVL